MKQRMTEQQRATANAIRPDFASYDWIAVSISGGKDSQATLDYVASIVPAELRDRIVTIHADLGRVEWKQTREIAEGHAKAYGLRFEVCQRSQNDLLDHVVARKAKLVSDGKVDAPAWMSPGARWCTSDHKRGPIWTVFTKLAAEKKHLGRQIRILDVQGLRGDESDERALKTPFLFNASASNGVRHVDTWLPIHGWTEKHVWFRITRSGVKAHYAYALGMKRVSCVFCMYAKPHELELAAKHNVELLAQYVAVEEQVGSAFQKGKPLKAIWLKQQSHNAAQSFKEAA